MKSSVFEWSIPNLYLWFRPFGNRTIRKRTFKTFGFRMYSVFECSEFEPPLYYNLKNIFASHLKNLKFKLTNSCALLCLVKDQTKSKG